MQKAYRKSACFVISVLILMLTPALVLGADSPINIDSYFDDWADKPHTPLTKGQDQNSGAMFLDGENLYIHLKLNDARGNQFPGNPMKLTINGQYKIMFNVMFRNPDNTMGDKINNLPAGNNLNLGVFENRSNTYLGDAAITIMDADHRTGDEAEMYISLETIRSFCQNIPLSEMQTLTLSCPNIGKEDITVTGTSTAPYWGIAAVLAVIGSVLLFRKRKYVVG